MDMLGCQVPGSDTLPLAGLELWATKISTFVRLFWAPYPAKPNASITWQNYPFSLIFTLSLSVSLSLPPSLSLFLSLSPSLPSSLSLSLSLSLSHTHTHIPSLIPSHSWISSLPITIMVEINSRQIWLRCKVRSLVPVQLRAFPWPPKYRVFSSGSVGNREPADLGPSEHGLLTRHREVAAGQFPRAHQWPETNAQRMV